jgi:hypothetical protein
MRRSCLTLLAVYVFVAPLRAITILPMSFAELVNESSAIVYGRVAEVQGQWTADRQRLESLVALEVLSAFKGAPGGTITFSIPGGQSGRYINLMPGAPTFTRGDLVVVFLSARGPRLPGPTGFTQGIYRVVADRASGSMLVVPPVIQAGADRSIVRGDPRRRSLSLAAFDAAVQAVQGVSR